MEEAYRHFNELLQANQRKAVKTCHGQGGPLNAMQQKYDNNDNTSNIQEEEMSAWLQSTMDDPFLRELWSDLFFTETKLTEDAGAPVEHVAMPDRPTKTKDAHNEGGGGSSSSTGSGTSEGVMTKKMTSGGMRKRKERRKYVEESDYVQTDEENEYQSTEVGARTRGASSSRRNRSSEVHNMSERRRRDRINEKMKALQELIPHCNKADKASMLDEAIDYLKSLQLQVQMMWMAKGIAPVTPPKSQSHASFMRPLPPMHAQGHLLQVPNAEASPDQMALDRISASTGDRFSSLIEAPRSQTRRTSTIFDMHARYLELQQRGTNSFGAYGSQSMQTNPRNVQKWQDR